jgi:heterodisulfide reductase subunit C
MENSGVRKITSQSVDSTFLGGVLKTEAGKKTLNCIQCGICAGSCHARFAMDYSPMQVIKMVNLGLKSDVLASSTIWICASCYTCTSRCPQGVDIPMLMSTLKNMALKSDVQAKIPSKPKFHKAFTEIVGQHGRMHEPQLQIKLLDKSNTGELFHNMLFGFKMWRKGKIRFAPSKVKQTGQIKAIFENSLKKEEQK